MVVSATLPSWITLSFAPISVPLPALARCELNSESFKWQVVDAVGGEAGFIRLCKLKSRMRCHVALFAVGSHPLSLCECRSASTLAHCVVCSVRESNCKRGREAEEKPAARAAVAQSPIVTCDTCSQLSN
jgi:hypothetical protein